MPGKEVAYVGKNVIIQYEGSLSGFAECAMGPELLASCMAAAADALPYAVSISPHEQGTYRRSWEVQPGVAYIKSKTGRSTIRRRVAALLVNTAPHSALVEWGGSPDGGRRHLAQHICRRVLEHIAAANPERDLD